MNVAKDALEQFMAKMRAEKAFSWEWADRNNVRPDQLAPVVVNDDGYKVKLMKFGLLPSWSREARLKFSTINAKSETVHQLPTYARPFRAKRAALIASGFYEFTTSPDGSVP
jgi:putative SOS response-associated peptidase YedK